MALLDVLALFRATDSNARTASGAQASFFAAGTTTPVDTYSNEAMTSLNPLPLVADAAGVFGPVYVPDGEYKIVIKDVENVTILEADDVRVESLPFTQSIADFQGYADLVGDEKLAYEAGEDVIVVSPGEIVRAGGNIYEIAPADATDWHLKTTGGVKLYERGPHFTSKDRFLNTIARIDDYPIGIEITAGGDTLRKMQDAVGDTGWFSTDDFFHPLIERKLDDAQGTVTPFNLSDAAKQVGFRYYGTLGVGGVDFAAPEQDASHKIRYGVASGNGTGTFDVVFNEPFDADCAGVVCTILGATSGTDDRAFTIKTSNPTATGFTARLRVQDSAGGAWADDTSSFFYMAMGR